MVTVQIQSEPLITDDLESLGGRWVLLRNHHVISSALDPVELDGVQEDDTVLLVPTASASTLVL